MSYFDVVKIGDKVWSIVNGWGKVIEIEKGIEITLTVEFPSKKNNIYVFDCNGKHYKEENQTLFWDEIKFEIPKKPKIELKYKNINQYIESGTQSESVNTYQQLNEFYRLLLLRDELCTDSKGHIHNPNKPSYCLHYCSKVDEYYVDSMSAMYYPGLVYFKTLNDAEKIRDIFNLNRFDLKL